MLCRLCCCDAGIKETQGPLAMRPAVLAVIATTYLMFTGRSMLASEALLSPSTIPRPPSSTLSGIVQSTGKNIPTRFWATKDSSRVEVEPGHKDAVTKSRKSTEGSVTKSNAKKKTKGRTSSRTTMLDCSLPKDHNGKVKPKAKTARKKSKKKTVPPKNNEPAYWLQESDEFILQSIEDYNESANATTAKNEVGPSRCKLIRFTVRGKPVPLRRHRTSKGFMYNPSAAAQSSFRQVVQDIVWPTDSKGKVLTTPLFSEDKYIAMTILFRLRRPKSHFVGGKPGPGRLRPSSPQHLHRSRTDVDNLAKFVLDSLNELLYVDDRQVVSLHATKVLDMEGNCEGATEVCMHSVNEDDVDDFLTNSLK